MPADPAFPRILLVEDRSDIAYFLSEALRRAGFDTATAADGQAAWELLSAAPAAFEVIITDNQMPRLTGLELVQKLHAAGFPGKVIVHSGNLAPQTIAAFEALGVKNILRKAVPFGAILQAIATAN